MSAHFSDAEMIVTSTRDRALLDLQRAGLADPAIRRALDALRADLLEPIRAHVGRPVHVNSGYRSYALNAQTPGASPTSQHMLGQAADLSIPGWGDADLEALARWVRDASGLPYGQVIYECRTPGRAWLHLSLGEPWRPAARSRQALRWSPAGGYVPL